MMDDPLAAYLEEVVEVLERSLGNDLVAVSLVGGAGAESFEPKSSDVDVAVVTERPAPSGALLSLASELSHQRRPVPARRLELVVYTRAGLARGEFILNLNTGSDIERADLDPAEAESFWFVLDLAVARGRSRALVGPALSALAPAPPRAQVTAAALQALDWFAAAEPGAPDTALNACRSWQWAVTDEWPTKAEAARWARPRLANPELIDEALRLRAEGSRDGLDPQRVRELAARAREALLAKRS
jgi:Domain of unknown function (DUF4111)